MNKDGGLLPLPNLIHPIFTVHNGPRDRDKQIIGRFFVTRLGMSLIYYKIFYLISILVDLLGDHSSNFPWQSWCDFGCLHGLCIVNWDSTIQAPGPNFDIRGLKASELHRLVCRINWGNNPYYTGGPALDIMKWEQPGKYDYKHYILSTLMIYCLNQRQVFS